MPNILASVGEPDLSTTVLGTKNKYAFISVSDSYAKDFHTPEGDKASARAAEKFDTFYSMSTMASFL